MKNKFNGTAILVGFFGNIGVSLLSAVLSGFIAGVEDFATDRPPAGAPGPWFMIWTFIFGMLSTGFGAYLAARISRKFPIHNAMAVGMIELVITLLMIPLLHGVPDWFLAAAIVSTLPCAYLAGKYVEGLMKAR